MDSARRARSTSKYRSGAIEIDAMQRSVSIDGTHAKVGARAFDLLMALVERRDRVVPKRELMDVVWPKLVVEEGNLLVHMVALRKLLGPKAIATIPGRGYRLVMALESVDDPDPVETPPSTDTARSNIPATPALLGRAQDLEIVKALLRDHAVVTVVGPGGIGKTCLAQVAAAVALIECPDGRWWAELASVTDGAQLPASIAGALGIQLSAAWPANEALALSLANKHLLLVLDNCEHLGDELPPLIDLLRARAPNVRMLVTSQESLKCRDEHVYRLGPLAIPHGTQVEEAAQFGAVALFVERAHAVDARFRLANDNVEWVVDICRRLDGIPLAIELAAARVPLLGIHGLHARLDQMFRILTGGTRMKLRRHQTLRAALEWSYGLLAPDEKRVFRKVGVFAGGFPLELAQQLIEEEQIDSWLVLDLLGHLIDKSLVIADGEPEPRYRLLETTRAFALEQLAAAGESEAMLQRHARVMCALMARTDANCWNLSPVERSRAIKELGNLRAAVDWTMATTDDATLRYELLAKCWLVWMHNGAIAEGMERMLKLWPPPSNLPQNVQADFCLGLARLPESPRREEQWEAVRRAEAIYRERGDADRLGDALLLVGTIGLDMNRLPEAEQALHEAENLVNDATALRKQAALASTQGQHFMWIGAPELSIAAFRRQVELYRSVGAVLGEYLALGNMGGAQLQFGDVEAAIDSLRTSINGLRRLNAPYGQAHRLGMLALALALRGDDADILALAREAFDHLRSLGATSSAVLAAALHHAKRDDLQRAMLLAAYALSAQASPGKDALPLFSQMQRQIRERATAKHPAATVASWLDTGGQLIEAQAAAIAFDGASLEALWN